MTLKDLLKCLNIARAKSSGVPLSLQMCFWGGLHLPVASSSATRTYVTLLYMLLTSLVSQLIRLLGQYSLLQVGFSSRLEKEDFKARLSGARHDVLAFEKLKERKGSKDLARWKLSKADRETMQHYINLVDEYKRKCAGTSRSYI